MKIQVNTYTNQCRYRTCTYSVEIKAFKNANLIQNIYGLIQVDRKMYHYWKSGLDHVWVKKDENKMWQQQEMRKKHVWINRCRIEAISPLEV